MDSSDGSTHQHTAADAITCAECGESLFEGVDRQETDDAVFCRPCFERLSQTVSQALAEQGENINYPMALVGGLGGAAGGIAVWWGFTVLTKIAFGLVAVVIGYAVGKGVTVLAGHKRHVNLQIMSVVITFVGFAYASYLVNRTFIIRAYADQGEEILLPLVPSFELLYNVVSAGFGVMDLVFLAIAIYQAWTMPAPVRMGR